jgi:hypothetical protein
MLTAVEAGLLDLISGRRARARVAELVAPPERVAGSAAERQSAENIRDLLRPYMDHCELEGYPAKVYQRGEGRLAVVSPTQLTVGPALVNAISGAGSGVGRLVDVGEGAAADFERLDGDLRGCVALAKLEAMPSLWRLGPLATEAKQRGMGCVLYHFQDRPHPSIHVSDADIPTLTISNEGAAQLRALLAEHGDVRVEYSVQIEEADGISYNVVGTIRGSEWPEQVIYVTSHHDTFFEGANDNNSSTAVLLELAELFKARRPKRTFKFVVFGGEEGGAERGSTLIYHDRGSLAFTEEYREILVGESDEMALAILNAEIVGFTPNAPVRSTPELVPLLWRVVEDLGVNRQAMDTRGFWTGSDHLCFHTLGVPSMEMMPDTEPGTGEAYWELYHTPFDNMGNVFEEALEANARAFALIALRLDADENPPLSLTELVAVARRELEVLPNAAAIGDLLRQQLEAIERLPSGRQRLRQQLAFIRAVYRNIYCFAGVGGHFTMTLPHLADTLARLREAYYLVAVDGDLARARAKLLATTDGQFAARSAAQYEDLLRRRARTEFIARWPNPVVDLREALRLAGQTEAPEGFTQALRNAVADAERLATETGQRFESDLRALIDASEDNTP